MAQRTSARADVVAGALHDLTEDIDELCSLMASELHRLRSARSAIENARHAYRRRTYVTELAQLRSAEDVFYSYARDLREHLHEARRRRATVDRLRKVKSEYADLLRLQQGISAALAVGSDWQSPVFEGSGHPTAGRHSGSVTEHLDDYKRDRHPQASAFEASYLREYVDVPPGFNVRALMTACGMAAFTTVLNYLCSSLGPPAAVVAAKGMYHECRQLLADSTLGARVCWVDEMNTGEVIDACRRLEPAAVFLDSMCNSNRLAVPDLQAIMFELAASAGRDVYLVIDNTCASIFCQPLHLVALNPRVRPLVFESLTKYGQFGLDRVAAGMIVAPEREAPPLDCLREHLGTNIADVCVSMVPEPNRALLTRRLRRLERNAQLLANHVVRCADERPGPIVGATYPALESHPCRGAARQLGFFGGFFAVEFRPDWDCAEGHGRFVSRVLHDARRRKVNLAAGASFGLNVTRVYRTATEIGLGPFVRVSAGTEDALEVEALKDVFASAIDALAL
jgi:cystathionine beta-lyase/cystathionine gamma-synthase